MEKLILPNKNVVKLEQQPEFPRTDLNSNNTDMLKYILAESSGLESQSEHLIPYQGYIHQIADYALKMSGVNTRYSEDELAAFSRGFASFETINLMVHPPRLYDIQTAQRKVRQLFLPPEHDPFELEAAELLGTADTYQPQATAFFPEIELAERQNQWHEKLPNTLDVIVDLGEKRHETMEQIHARAAGAHIAYQLASEELDAA